MANELLREQGRRHLKAHWPHLYADLKADGSLEKWLESQAEDYEQAYQAEIERGANDIEADEIARDVTDLFMDPATSLQETTE